jgi:hypothetical protein
MLIIGYLKAQNSMLIRRVIRLKSFVLRRNPGIVSDNGLGVFSMKLLTLGTLKSIYMG